MKGISAVVKLSSFLDRMRLADMRQQRILPAFHRARLNATCPRTGIRTLADQSRKKPTYLEMRLAALPYRLLEELESRDQGLHQQLSIELRDGRKLWGELTELLERLLHEQDSLDTLRNVAEALRRTQERTQADLEVNQVQRFLVSLLKKRLEASERSESRKTAVTILSLAGSAAPEEAAEMLLGLVDDPDPAVAEAALRNLVHLPLDIVPGAIAKLSSLLPSPPKGANKTNTPESRRAAGRPTKLSQIEICFALSLKGKGVVEALSSLAWTAGNSGEREVKEAAARAIAGIDPEGEWLAYSIDDEEQRKLLMHSLHEAGEHSLLDKLKDAWIAAESRGPWVGFKRMLKKEIGSYVFGLDGLHETPGGKKSALDSNDRKRLANRISKRIDDWIEKRSLRAIRIGRGHYDVNVDDLEVLRKLYFGQNGDAEEPPEESASGSEQ